MNEKFRRALGMLNRLGMTDDVWSRVRATVMPNVKQAVPFFMVTDIEASLRFYVDGLGFAVTNEWRPEGTGVGSGGAGFSSATLP